MRVAVFLTLTVALSPSGLWSKDARSRAEGLPGVSASNTVGVGSIWLAAQFHSFFQTSVLRAATLQSLVEPSIQGELSEVYDLNQDRAKRDLMFVPLIAGTIGLTEFMHFEARAIPWDGSKIGVTSGHLKLTFPNTGKLRVFGAAIVADVTLSTEENIITVQEETPAFDPIISFTGIVDFDLVKYSSGFPLKIYANYSNLDNYRVYRMYDQHTVKIGIELKRPFYSFYLRWGSSFYREKENDINPNPGGGFELPVNGLGIGYKKRFVNDYPYSLVVDLSGDPIQPAAFLNNELNPSPTFKIGLEWPLFYKESRSEAIRTLIFAELKEMGEKSGETAAETTFEELTLHRLTRRDTAVDVVLDRELGSLLEDSEAKDRERKRHHLIQELISK